MKCAPTYRARSADDQMRLGGRYREEISTGGAVLSELSCGCFDRRASLELAEPMRKIEPQALEQSGQGWE